MGSVLMILQVLLFVQACLAAADSRVNKLRVFTVATDINADGFHRFNRSANVYGLKVEVLGANLEWRGGDVQRYPGGGQKVILLKDGLKRYKDDKDLIVLFVDSYDVILSANEAEIISAFKKFEADVVFSAEGFCWPDATLSNSYPLVEGKGQRFLNSGGFIGYASQIYSIVNQAPIEDSDDDQLYYTKIYLDKSLRSKYNMKLDHKANIFQNLNGAIGDVELKFFGPEAYVENSAYRTHPKIIHGNGPSKIHLNTLGNYLARSWSHELGCMACNESAINIKDFKADQIPLVLIGIFIERPTPFMEEFFEYLLNLKWPKHRLALFIRNNVDYHNSHVTAFINHINEKKYKFYHVIELPKKNSYPEWKARELGLEECLKINCDYYLNVDSEARLTNPRALGHLIEMNKSIVAPMLPRHNALWSNFWGALSSEGYYSRSFDYVEIVRGKRRGLWNVPHISTAYLIKSDIIKRSANAINNAINQDDSGPEPPPPEHRGLQNIWFNRPELDPDMAFTANLRDRGQFMYVSNLHDYGHLAANDEFIFANRTHPDLFEMFNNRIDWQRRYIHENWTLMVEPDTEIEQPCQDVFRFPVVTERFTKALVETMEHYGRWSTGANQDERLAGGYENVPTRDIHLNQVGLEAHWLQFLRDYIRPVQEKLYQGYFHDPPKAIMNFVVRYKPDEQPLLRPHHDASTYTINVALNRAKIDYEGGGCRFIRYNCSVTNMQVGWSLIHPGRLTHYHEGLRVTKGTRYIMVSFVDP